MKNENIRAVLFDLGYSLNQIKDNKKGLSFNSQGELNMKLGLNDFSAHEVINNLGSNDLQKIFKYFGEEKEAKKIANKIENERANHEINTQDLVNIIDSVKREIIPKFIVQQKFFRQLGYL